jgi:hypothetical protein
MDLDNVRDPQTGKLALWAGWVATRLETYAEVSPSGRGVKLLCWGTLPRGRRADHGRGVEMYDGRRYFTLTGHRVPDTSADVMERRDVLAELYDELLAEHPAPAGSQHQSDRELALAALQALSLSRAEGYDTWLGVGMALHSVDPSQAMLAEWDRWSRNCPERYEEGACARKWQSFSRGGITLGSLIHWAGLDGWQPTRNGRARTAEDPTSTPPPPGAPASWPEPIPLGEGPVVPAFSLECLPGWLRSWVSAEAEATQTPPDLAGLLSLDVCGAGLATKYRVEVRRGWTEPTNLFVVIALPPGDRKSAVFRDATAPVQEHEQEEAERAAEEIAAASSMQRVLEARLKDVEKRTARAKGPEEKESLAEQSREAARELARHVVPNLPQFVCDDCTPERLSSLLAVHNGRMLQAAAEGTAFEIAKGRYSETANFDVYLKGHAGDALRVDRVSRGREFVESPALSMALAVQPDVLRGLAEQATMRGRGFLARFLYCLPRSMVGARQIAPRPVDNFVARIYREGTLQLWKSTGTVDEKGKVAPRTLRFSVEADRQLRDFEAKLEPRLAEGEDLSYLAGWAQKLAGTIARIAGILHVVQAVDDGTNWEAPITAATVEKAIRLGRDYLLPHAQAAFGMMAADPRIMTARAVWETICRRVSERSECHESAPPSLEITRRDIHQWNRRRFESVKEADPVLELLERHQLIRQKVQPGQLPGRGHPSPVFEVNPAAFADFKKQEGRTRCTHSTHSRGEEDP